MRSITRVFRQAFEHRRKTLRNSLAKARVFGLAEEAVMAALADAGVDAGRRPQTVSLDEFAAVTRELRRHIT
jgi:16S rRNA (adenine1518-N6/adenine1519-N6)-dimethyltransferase